MGSGQASGRGGGRRAQAVVPENLPGWPTWGVLVPVVLGLAVLPASNGNPWRPQDAWEGCVARPVSSAGPWDKSVSSRRLCPGQASWWAGRLA